MWVGLVLRNVRAVLDPLRVSQDRRSLCRSVAKVISFSFFLSRRSRMTIDEFLESGFVRFNRGAASLILKILTLTF